MLRAGPHWLNKTCCNTIIHALVFAKPQCMSSCTKTLRSKAGGSLIGAAVYVYKGSDAVTEASMLPSSS
jgi:hypothetical protein